MIKFYALIMIASLIVTASAAFAHGVVGDYTFIEPLIAEDANPKNEFDILQPQWRKTSEGREFSLGFSLEKMLAPNFSVEIGSTWTTLSPKEGADVSGFDSLEIFPKYAFLTMPEHEFRLSIAADLELPTGNPSVQSQNHTALGPVLLWAKGLGDIRDWYWFKYLRPLGLEGDLGYVPALGGHTSHEMFADQVVEYSMPYLSDNVRDIGLGWPLRNIYLFTEFNYDQLITGPSGETFPDIRITPGIAYMGHYIQLSLATQFPLNQATAPDDHAAVLGLLDIFIDDLIPQTNWVPL